MKEGTLERPFAYFRETELDVVGGQDMDLLSDLWENNEIWLLKKQENEQSTK